MMCHVELANPPNPFPKQNKKKTDDDQSYFQNSPHSAHTCSNKLVFYTVHRERQPGDRGRPVFTIYARCPHKARWESQPPSEKV